MNVTKQTFKRDLGQRLVGTSILSTRTFESAGYTEALEAIKGYYTAYFKASDKLKSFTEDITCSCDTGFGKLYKLLPSPYDVARMVGKAFEAVDDGVVLKDNPINNSDTLHALTSTLLYNHLGVTTLTTSKSRRVLELKAFKEFIDELIELFGADKILLSCFELGVTDEDLVLVLLIPLYYSDIMRQLINKQLSMQRAAANITQLARHNKTRFNNGLNKVYNLPKEKEVVINKTKIIAQL